MISVGSKVPLLSIHVRFSPRWTLKVLLMIFGIHLFTCIISEIHSGMNGEAFNSSLIEVHQIKLFFQLKLKKKTCSYYATSR